MRTRGVRTSPGLVALLFGLVLLSGCATRHGQSLSNRFVVPGKPAVDLGGPPVGKSDEQRQKLKKAVQAAATTPRRSANFGATIEGSDKRLAAALLAETVFPTMASHLQVAEEYRRIGVLDAAYDGLKRALQKEPRSAVAHEALARVWRDWGMAGEGLGAAYRAAYYDRQSASAQNTLGTLLDALGRPEDARAAFQRALVLDPAASWALNNLCYVDFRLGRLKEAQAECAAALRLTPDFVAAHNNMGLIHAAAGEFVQARRSFLEAGDEAAADFNLGIVYLRDSDYASAADAFEEAIKARPDFTAAKTRAHAARMRMISRRIDR
jgi:tetratricopeptide (TPR) repeat protein